MNKSFRVSLAIFLGIFVLTQDYLLVARWPDILFGGLPIWLFYFVAIHLVFIVAIYRLAEVKSSEQ